MVSEHLEPFGLVGQMKIKFIYELNGRVPFEEVCDQACSQAWILNMLSHGEANEELLYIKGVCIYCINCISAAPSNPYGLVRPGSQ